MISIKFARLNPADIFNACDHSNHRPFADLVGDDWPHSRYEELRKLIAGWYVEEFDAMTGHFSRLEYSIKKSGIQNPIVVTAGEPFNRPHLPDHGKRYICESTGGSRLYVAAKLGVAVPCIINDRIGVAGEPLYNASDVLAKFHDETYLIKYGPPVRTTPARFSHMSESYTMGEQQHWKRKAEAIVRLKVKSWLNTRKSGKATDTGGSPRHSIGFSAK